MSGSSADRPSADPAVRLVPETADPDTGGFFAAAAREELAVCACAACGAVLHPPGAYCAACGRWDTVWRTVSGRGRLYSWTTVEHQTHRAFPVPYTIVLVELDDAPGARLVGHLPGRPELEAGMPMRVWFEPVDDDGTLLPQWKPESRNAPVDGG
ncbi:MAG: OB-fold domain-containing protein [Actinobacteria bacterium]|nr:OB-fold domain-containing protein [Actinomycetota bacterium]